MPFKRGRERGEMGDEEEGKRERENEGNRERMSKRERGIRGRERKIEKEQGREEKVRRREGKRRGERRGGERRRREGGREGTGREKDWQVNKQVYASVSLGKSRGVGMEGWLTVDFFVAAGGAGGSEGRGKEERTKVEGEREGKGEKTLQVEQGVG